MTAPSSGVKARFAYLDGIRGLAILAVVIVHWGIGRTTLGRGGFVSVDVFFVLSGFVITTLLWRSRSASGSLGADWWTFTRNRLRRLYPALLGLLVVGSFLVIAAPDAPVGVSETLRNALLSLAQLTWVPEMGGETAEPFRQTWSLGVEWLFYLSWPVVVYAARRRGVSSDRLALGCALTGLALIVATTALLSHEAYYFFPPGRFGQILLGAALAFHVFAHPPAQRRRPVATAATLLGLAFFVVFALAGAHPFSDTGRLLGTPVALVLAVLLIWHGYATTATPVHAILESRPVALLGRVSYSLYLWHWIPVYLLDKDTVALPGPVLAVLGVALVAVLTTLSYVLLERPFLSSRRSALSPTQDASGSTSSGSVTSSS